MFRNISIRTQLKLLLLCAGAIMILLFSTVYLYFGTRSVVNSLNLETRQVADLLGTRLATSIEFGLIESIESKMKDLTLDDSYSIICVHGTKGQVLARRFSKESVSCPVVNIGNNGFILSDSFDAEAFSAYAISNVWAGPKMIGAVVVTRGREPINNYLYEQLNILFAVTVISLVIYLVIASRLQLLISKPIIEISNSAKDIMLLGDPGSETARSTNDEIQYINDALILLSQRVHHQIENLSRERDRQHTAYTNIRGGIKTLLADYKEIISAISAYDQLTKHKVFGENMDNYEDYKGDVFDSVMNCNAKFESFKRISDLYYNALLEDKQRVNVGGYLNDFSELIKQKLPFVTSVTCGLINANCCIDVYKSAWDETFAITAKLYENIAAFVQFNVQINIFLDQKLGNILLVFCDRQQYMSKNKAFFQDIANSRAISNTVDSQDINLSSGLSFTDITIDAFIEEPILSRDQLKYVIDMITYISSANEVYVKCAFDSNLFVLSLDLKLEDADSNREISLKVPEYN